MKKRHEVMITPERAVVDGMPIPVTTHGFDMLTELFAPG